EPALRPLRHGAASAREPHDEQEGLGGAGAERAAARAPASRARAGARGDRRPRAGRRRRRRARRAARRALGRHHAHDRRGGAASTAAEGVRAPALIAAKLRLALLDSVGGLVARAPLALLFEDVQWADPPSLDLVDELQVRFASSPLFVLETGRAEPATAPRV